MTLLDTGRAIGEVTRMLRNQLSTRIAETHGLASIAVTVGRPTSQRRGAGSTAGRRLNLFLYESHFDQFLKNIALRENTPAPVWLVLKYLLTAFDEQEESDSPEAHDLLGQGVQTLQAPGLLVLSESSHSPLMPNPEMLRITFEESPPDLLSKVMQGPDEKYRFSIGFEVRPVMIATEVLPTISPLVGVDYSKSPVERIAEKGLRIPVISSMGPHITSINPSKIEVNSTVSVFGENLDLPDLSVLLGQIQLPHISRGPAQLEFVIDASIVKGDAISAGSHAISIVQTLPNGKQRSSNLSVFGLLPTLSAATIDSIERVDSTFSNSDVYGDIVLTGKLLGTDKDDIFVALYKDGKTVRVFSEPAVVAISSSSSPPPSPPMQTQLRLEIKERDAVPQGTYHIVLRVNEQQAKDSPAIEFVS
jgi:hypothetical protein